MFCPALIPGPEQVVAKGKISGEERRFAPSRSQEVRVRLLRGHVTAQFIVALPSRGPNKDDRSPILYRLISYAGRDRPRVARNRRGDKNEERSQTR